MKAPAPDAQNVHIIALFKRTVLLPFTTVSALWRMVCRWIQRCKSPGQVREEDQLRQSRARRTLRGLPPDHDRDSHKPS